MTESSGTMGQSKLRSEWVNDSGIGVFLISLCKTLKRHNKFFKFMCSMCIGRDNYFTNAEWIIIIFLSYFHSHSGSAVVLLLLPLQLTRMATITTTVWYLWWRRQLWLHVPNMIISIYNNVYGMKTMEMKRSLSRKKEKRITGFLYSFLSPSHRMTIVWCGNEVSGKYCHQCLKFFVWLSRWHCLQQR